MANLKSSTPARLDFSRLTLQDALDVAVLIEAEAEERYQDFVRQLGHRYGGDASDFFTQMVANERKHGEQILARRKKRFGDAPSKVNSTLIWDVEAPATGLVRAYMSVHQAVSLAMIAENKARDFFENALKNVKDPEVKKLFEELRDEEIAHYEALVKFQNTLPPDTGPDRDDEDLDDPPALG